MPKAYSYIRFSTPEQRKGDSLRRQIEESAKYAREHDLTLDESLTYKDLGVSAYDRSNVLTGQLGAFLTAIEKGQVQGGSVLLVESLDRISRAEVLDALEVFTRIIKRGIKIVTLTDRREYTEASINLNPTELMMSILVMSRAYEESNTKSRRLKEVWAAKRKQASERKMTRVAPAWLRYDSALSQFRPIPDRARIVQRIFRETIGGIGSGTIARRFNEENTPTFRSAPDGLWYASYVKKIIESRAVLGEYQPHTVGESGKPSPEGPPIKDYFPRLVSDEDFALASAARRSRRIAGAGRKGKTYSNLFSGFVRCGHCLGAMCYVDKGSKSPSGKFLVCHSAKLGKKTCHYIRWEYLAFEIAVLTYCQGLDLKALLRDSPDLQTALNELEGQIEATKARVKEKATAFANLRNAIEQGATFPEFATRLNELHGEQTALELAVKALEAKAEEKKSSLLNVDDVVASVSELSAKMRDLSGDALFNLRAKLSSEVKRLVKKIVMFPGGLITPAHVVAQLRSDYRAKGLTDAQIAETFNGTIFEKPNPSERYFMLMAPNNEMRIIKPDINNPTVMTIDAVTGKMTDAVLSESIGQIREKEVGTLILGSASP